MNTSNKPTSTSTVHGSRSNTPIVSYKPHKRLFRIFPQMSSFTIDVSELAKPSKKPKFLSMRFRSHSSAFGQNVDQKRNELLQQKKQKLQHHHAKIHQKKPVVGMSLDRLQSELDKAAERREQLLDRKKQGWGNIVKRAKVIAKIQKRQSLMDRLMKQKRIDEKLRKSDLRRKGLVVREDEAASKIQQWYRQTKFKPLVRIYTKIGMNRQKTKELGFEVAVKKVTNPTLVKLANFIVLRSRKMTGEKRKLNSPGKMLLSAFLICCYPIETVGEMNELVNLASRLVHQVETWLHPALDTELIVPLGTLFFNTFIEFNNAFEAWKNKDASGLVDEIVGRVCDLDRLWVKVMDQIDATDQWAPSIDKQFQDHLKRIVKMAGMSGVSKMMSARGIVMKEMEMNSKVKLDQSPTIVYPVQEPQDSVAEEMDVDAAPDEETLKQFGGILSNEYLAHELVMDPEFKLQKPKVDPNVERISIIARKAFTDKLRTEIEQKNYMHSVLGIVLEMKQGLLGMLEPQGGIAKEISQVLDKEYLHHQIKHHVFELEKVLTFIGLKMRALCAPVRDAALRALETETDVATIMLKMSEILEDMKLDMSNFRLQQIKPQLVSQAVEYEKSKFNKALATKRVELNLTKKWLQETVEELEEKRQSRNPEKVELPKLLFEQVYNAALMRLFFSTSAITPQTVPETLTLDAKRVFEMQNEIQALTIVSALTMLSKNLLPTLKRNEPATHDLSKKLFELLALPSTNFKTLANEIISSANTELHKETKRMADLSKFTTTTRTQELKMVTEEQEQLVLSMVEKTLSFKDPFFSILLRRIEKAVRMSLDGSELTVGQVKKMGLDVVCDGLLLLLKRIVTLAKHNKKVYAEHYDAILATLV